MTTYPAKATLQFGFPRGTRVCPGEGELVHSEMWFLVNPDQERQDDWNTWIVMDIRDDSARQWQPKKVVPIWGRYEPLSGLVGYIGERMPDAAYNPVVPPPGLAPPYQSRSSSSWQGY